jgi:erythromycin esterase-like protein
MPIRSQLLNVVRNGLRPLTSGRPDYESLLQRMGETHFVLIGEASHGTYEFYKHRAEITKRLIEEKGFHAVAAEADWPDADRVNRYVRGRGANETAEEALSGFTRFRTWMWSNDVVAEFISWLRTYNARSGAAHQAGF